MIRFIPMTLELSKELNKYIDSNIKKYALFDSDFTEEYLYYQSKEAITDSIINNYVLAVADNANIIGYLVLNIFIDENNIKGCNINPIIVFNPYRNKGYGCKIITSLYSSNLIKEDIKYYECAIDKTNIESIALFNKSGFIEYDDKDNFIYMRKGGYNE